MSGSVDVRPGLGLDGTPPHHLQQAQQQPEVTSIMEADRYFFLLSRMPFGSRYHASQGTQRYSWHISYHEYIDCINVWYSERYRTM